jgi:hypothetical protein
MSPQKQWRERTKEKAMTTSFVFRGTDTWHSSGAHFHLTIVAINMSLLRSEEGS